MAKKSSKVGKTLKKTLKRIEKSSLLKNKVVSYVVLLAAITLALVYISKSNWNALAMYIAIGLLTCFFTKNMTVTLGTAIIVSVILNRKALNIEGFEEENKNTEQEEKEDTMATNEKRKCWKKNEDGEYVREGEDDVLQKECAKPMFCWENDKGDCPKKAGFNNKSIPSSKPARVDGGNDDDESEGDRIDHSKTLEQAYDNLQNMLGTDGIKGLTGETSKLIEQQRGLMDSIKGMGPMMKQAEQMMGALQGMGGGMGGLGKMLGGKK